MVITMIRVRLAVRLSTIGERFAYRYGETTAPLSPSYRAFVRWDGGETAWMDPAFLEAREWMDGRGGGEGA